MFTLEDGKVAVRTARKVIEAQVKGKTISKLDLPASFNDKGGVFVTINTHPSKDLRGCIGYPEPVLKLKEALVDAAKSASTRDPRFPEVKPKELDKIVVEVSLLTTPEIIKVSKPSEYLQKIVIGRDGLIAERLPFRGLLLPQVPVEWDWDVHEFLDHTCMKAGLSAGAWADKETSIYRFQAQIFDEVEPNGDIVERPLVKG